MDLKKAQRIKKIVISFSGLMLLTVSIIAGVILVQRRSEYITPAEVKIADVYIEPSSQSLPPDSVFKVMINPNNQEVVFAKVVVRYDFSKLELINENINTTPYMSDVVKKEVINDSLSESTRLITVALAVPVIDSPPIDVFEFANFSFRTLSKVDNDSTVLELIASDIQIVGRDTSEYQINVKNSNLTLNPVVLTSTPTPTPTSTPTPTTVLTSTPTPIPTSSNQTCSSVGGVCRRFCYTNETNAGRYDCTRLSPYCCIPEGGSTYQ